MINLVSFDRQKFIAERIKFKSKYSNVKYLDIITNQIKSAVDQLPNLSGTISYKNGDAYDNIKGDFLYYNYGSPAPYFCKLLPNGYGFTHFNPNDLYKEVQPEQDIHQKLYNLYKNGLLTRYKQPDNYSKLVLPESYILVAMQNTKDTVWYRGKSFTEQANDIIRWSRESKKTVLFKWHFGCIDHNDPQLWWEELEEKSDYAIFDHTTPLNVLIENCDMMWTASSMSGIEALVCNKPVSIFGQTEYMEMATVSSDPDILVNAKIPEDLNKWLTYYFRFYCINILDKNAKDIIKNRILNIFDKGLDLNAIILSR